nr:hypothetical protein StreXyl84_72580 [Streptomyces sp. Xyl84]
METYGTHPAASPAGLCCEEREGMRHSDVLMDDRAQEHSGSRRTAVLTADKGASAPSHRAPGAPATPDSRNGAHRAAEDALPAQWRVAGGG